MRQKFNAVYAPLLTEENKRYFIFIGGRGGGRSFTASQYAVSKLVGKSYYRCAIMRLILGDVRKSIYQEIKDRLEDQEIDSIVDIKDLSFQCGDNRIDGLGFKKSTSDQKSKLKSLAGYTDVIIEEADEISEDDFNQLDDSLRTTKSDIRIILLLNPPDKNHWIIKRFFNLIPSGIDGFYDYELKPQLAHNTVCLKSNYRDNIDNINETTIANFERYRITKPDHYYNMIKGYVSEGLRGRIFKTWQRCTREEFEELPYTSYFGIDFGFTNDPTALLEIKEHNNKVWFRELIYQTGLTNPMIAKRFADLGITMNDEIYADSAEAKSIEELKQLGYNVMPAEKGPGSVNAGLDMLLDKEVYYTDDSENLDLENQNYCWALDKNKEPTNNAIDDFNHLMDAGRYGVYTKSKQGFIGFV